jgi:hypothetical protein
MYDAIKQLASNTRFAGKQYTEFEMVHTVRKYGAINQGEMYAMSHTFAGADTSAMPVLLSSDTTVVCKKMGAHPIICESACYMHVYLYVSVCIDSICMY